MIMQVVTLFIVLATLVLATVEHCKGKDWQWWAFITLFNLIVLLKVVE